MQVQERYKQQLKNAKKHKEEILKALKVDCISDDDLILATTALAIKKQHSKACIECHYTVEDCGKCEYNSKQFDFQRHTNRYVQLLVDECPKDKVRKIQERTDRIINKSGMGVRFKQRLFKTFEATTPSAQHAKYFAETFCKKIKSDRKNAGIMFMGECGCGKTHLAAAVIHQAAEVGIPGAFVVVPELLAKLRASFAKKSDDSTDTIIDTVKNAPLLVLDDLAAEKQSEWSREQLYLIINYRYEHMLPIIATTNVSGAELEHVLGKRIVSRLVEMTVPVKIEAADYRMKSAKEMVID